MSIAPAAVEVLTALQPVLERWGPWYLFGAQAVVAHGCPRLSADVDVTLRLTPDSPDGLARDMEAAGFQLRVVDPEFVRRTRVMPFVHLTTGMPLDVVLAGSGLEDEFLSRARVLEIGGVGVPVIHPEDLIIAKVVAGRPKDLEDCGASKEPSSTGRGSCRSCASWRKRSARATSFPSSNRYTPAEGAVLLSRFSATGRRARERAEVPPEPRARRSDPPLPAHNGDSLRHGP